ncbi:MAG TPA: cysteine hydrolase [Gemmatimonadaceae bacterium]|nr:cysteine hydrolase [Gemmatimonadaceae bacterium]
MQHAFGLDIPTTLEDLSDPRVVALLVYDMQVGILRQLPDASPTITRALKVLAAARDAGVRTLFTRHVSLPLQLAGSMQLRTAMAWQRVDRVDRIRPAFPPDAPQTQLIPELAPRPSEFVLDKISMSAFVGTPLELILRDCGIKALVVVGVALEVGIEPTARHAADLGFIPVLVSDACGGRDQAAMRRSLESLAFAGDAMITDSATLCGRLRGASSSSRYAPASRPIDRSG